MKRYLFLKLCLTIFCYATAASTRSEVSDNGPQRDESRRHSREDSGQVVTEVQDGDTKNLIKNYQVFNVQGVMGKPGVDFPVLTYIPRTSFTCRGVKSGYYADLDTNCQVFHICDEGRKVSFLCPNGTIFQQSDLICDWWFKVDCASSPSLYEESAEQLQEDNHKRKEARRQYELKRLQHVESRSEERSSKETSQEFSRRRQSTTSKFVDQNNIAKKDVNNYVGNYGNEEEKKPEKVYKETQVLAETASFVNKKFSDQPYFRSINDFGANKVNYLPQRTHADNRVTEKPNNRGGRTFESSLTTAKPYRGRNNDYLKTTTQHTIYSPTVPPITATKYTTKIPSIRPVQTSVRPQTTTTTLPTTLRTTTEPVSTTTRNNFNGFYITKTVDTTTYNPERFGERETTTVQPIEYTTQPDKRTRDLEKSFATYDFTKYDFTSRRTTSPYRTTITTITPTGFSSVATTETYKQTTKADKSTTLSQFTYLPNSTPGSTVRPTSPTPYTSYTTQPSITDNLSNMIKTLQNLDSEDPNIEKLLVSRPGLNIPPSAGPNTLHSLAVYFATALDNLVSNDTDEKTTTTEPPPSTIAEEEDRLVTLLSRSTVDKYNLLFNDNQEDKDDNGNGGLDIKSLVEHNDLDGQQSQGPLGGTPRIRQLAQVFTQALSAYLDDPETFKRVLEEIRPTEPPQSEEFDFNTESTQAFTTEYASYTKEEDEVLDFSDSDKTTTHSTTTTTEIPRTTERVILNEISTSYPDDSGVNVHRDSRAENLNALAIDLNNSLRYSSTPTTTTQNSYLPEKNNENDEDVQKRLTSKPYGYGVKITHSTPTTDIGRTVTPTSWSYNQINTNLSELQPFDALLPPYEVTSYNSSKSSFRDEYLQSAHSQSFVAHGSNSIVADRKGKALAYTLGTTTDRPRTEAYQYTTIQTDISTTPFSIDETTYYTSTPIYTTTQTTEPTTEYTSTTEMTTEYPTTQKILNNHWSQSPFVTKLWETTLYVNPLIINRNLDIKSDYNATSGEEVTTTTAEPTTTTNFYNTTSVDSITTTETTEILDRVPQLSEPTIHGLLNTSELEIASSQANQLFGNLDLFEQDLLMEKMKMAESNSTVRRLILLLVSTCDASLNQNKTVQETRNYILHALLGIPMNKTGESVKSEPDLRLKRVQEPLPLPLHIKSRSGKAIREERVENSVTTEVPQESTTLEIVTSSKSYTITDRKPIQVPINKDLTVRNVHQNTRALELLRSLYSLAAKWSNK